MFGVLWFIVVKGWLQLCVMAGSGCLVLVLGLGGLLGCVCLRVLFEIVGCAYRCVCFGFGLVTVFSCCLWVVMFWC